MRLKAIHKILIAGEDFDSCRHKALRFFERNLLIRYDIVLISDEAAINAWDASFWEMVEEGMTANREVLKELAEELAGEGYKSVDDLFGMAQGANSKTLHTVVHMLDGFFGVDTHFYSYEDESHWVSEATRQRIKADPDGFWLLKVTGESRVGDREWVQSLRKAEAGVTKEEDS